MYCRTGPREIRVRTPRAYAQQGVGGDQGREATNDRVCDRTDGKVSSIRQSPHLFLQPYFCRVFGTLARTEMLYFCMYLYMIALLLKNIGTVSMNFNIDNFGHRKIMAHFAQSHTKWV